MNAVYDLHSANDVACPQGNVDVECLILTPSSALEEYYGIVEESISTEDLRHPHDTILAPVNRAQRNEAYDFSPPQICPLEALDKAGAGSLSSFQLGSVVDVCHGRFDIDVGAFFVLPQGCQGLSGIVVSSSSDRVPGRFRGKVRPEEQEWRPYPLEAIWQSPSCPS